MLDRYGIDRQHEGHAARQEHPGERDDEGRHFQIMDDRAHDRTEQRGDDKDQNEGRERMDAGALQHDGEENAGEGDDRADRQVDAARQDNEGHADGGDAKEGVVGQKIADHARGQDVRILRRAGGIGNDEDDDGRNQRKVFLVHRMDFRLRKVTAGPHARRLDDEDDDDDGGLDDQVEFRREAGQKDAGVDRLNDHRACQRSDDAETAAEQRGASDDDRKDGVQFQPQAGIVGVRALDVGSDDQAGDRCAKAGKHIGRHQQQRRLNARKRAGAAVDPNGLDQHAEGRSPHQKRNRDTECQPYDDGHRQAHESAAADEDQTRIIEGQDRALGHQLRDAASRNHQDERGNDGLDVEDGYKKAIPDAANEACAKREQQRDDQRITPHAGGGGNGAANGHHGADRKVDTLGGDDNGHADRKKGDGRTAIENVDQAAVKPTVLDLHRKETRKDEPNQHKDNRQGYQLREQPLAETCCSFDHAWSPAPGAAAMALTMMFRGDLAAGQFRHMGAIPEHDDPRTVGHEFFELRRNDDQRHALTAEFADQPDDFGVGADIDAARRLVENEKFRVRRQPARQDGFLLVAAGQKPDRLLAVAGADVERLDVAVRKGVLFGCRQMDVPSRAAPATPGRCSRAPTVRR